MSLPRDWTLHLPDWAAGIVATHAGPRGDVAPPDRAQRSSDARPEPHDEDSAMALAIELARAAAAHEDGGPFGAAVIDPADGRLVAAGPNLVFAGGASLAHAEMVALTLAQRALATPDLSESGELTLVSSAEPCAMCLGALPWSGVRRLVCGARDADVRAVGFDEGSKPAGWVEALEARGIGVVRDVRREEAVKALRTYVAGGGRLY